MKFCLVLSALLLSASVQAQPKPANQITKQDIKMAMDREMHVMDIGLVDTCTAQFPALAKGLATKREALMRGLTPDLVEYRKTPEFAKALREHNQEQAAEAKKPENKVALEKLCAAAAQ